MKVSLVDVDGHNFPNLALMKLSAWHKAQGDEVDWYMPLFSHPDRIYASKVFTFTQDFTDYNPIDPKPTKGGTGYDTSITLPDEVESMSPDYSIYPQYDYAIGFLTRGCIRKCKWCVVPRKEGTLHVVGDIEKIGVRKHVVLMDNNFLAADEDFVHEQLEKSKRLKLQIDFNQALDARLVTTKNAEWLAKCSWNPYIRFSCDTPPHDRSCCKRDTYASLGRLQEGHFCICPCIRSRYGVEADRGSCKGGRALRPVRHAIQKS